MISRMTPHSSVLLFEETMEAASELKFPRTKLGASYGCATLKIVQHTELREKHHSLPFYVKRLSNFTRRIVCVFSE